MKFYTINWVCFHAKLCKVWTLLFSCLSRLFLFWFFLPFSIQDYLLCCLTPTTIQRQREHIIPWKMWVFSDLLRVSLSLSFSVILFENSLKKNCLLLCRINFNFGSVAKNRSKLHRCFFGSNSGPLRIHSFFRKWKLIWYLAEYHLGFQGLKMNRIVHLKGKEKVWIITRSIISSGTKWSNWIPQNRLDFNLRSIPEFQDEIWFYFVRSLFNLFSVRVSSLCSSFEV